MILGDNLIGIISEKFKEKDLNAYVLKINLFPFALIFEKHYDIKYYEIKIILFEKYNLGIYISK